MQVDLPAVGATGRLLLVNAFDDAGTPCVLPDDVDGQQSLTTALIADGHHRIGFLTLPAELVAHGLRLDGYRRALADAGIPYDPELVRECDRSGGPEERDLLLAAVDGMLALDRPPTVLCCGNDRLAVAVYGLLRARDRRAATDVGGRL